MFPYHEIKRLIHNIRHPEKPDDDVICSGIEALGWLLVVGRNKVIDEEKLVEVKKLYCGVPWSQGFRQCGLYFTSW